MNEAGTVPGDWLTGLEDDDASAPVRPRRGQQEDAEMDITPMIDITFLMLIFFLVASTPDKQTAVDLPKASHGIGVSQLQSVLFTVGESGMEMAPVYNSDGKIPEHQLSDDPEQRRQQIRDAVEQGFRENKTKVVIKGDKNLAYRQVESVIRAVSEVEGVQIHLAVLESK